MNDQVKQEKNSAIPSSGLAKNQSVSAAPSTLGGKPMSVVDDVKKELDELKTLGVEVPAGAYSEAEKSAQEYSDGGMQVSEIADLCIQLGGMK